MEFNAGLKYRFFHYLLLDINAIVTKKKLPSIRWEYNQSNGNMSIPFNGIPYMLLVAQDYQCHQGKDMHKASKEHYQKDKKIQQSFDHCVLKSRKLAQHTKKVDCPFVLSVKKILTFPLFKIEKDTKRRRAEAAKKIMSYLEEMKKLGKVVKSEEFKGKLHLCQFPDPSAHQNHHTGQAAGISEPLDNRVVEYLKKQIREGCRRTKDLQSRAKLFVDQTILLEENPTIFRH